MLDLPPAHIGSGLVVTVSGPIPVGDMGVTLMHEHGLNDCRCWWHQPKQAWRQRLACEPVHPGIIGELGMNPFVNLDNCRLDDERLAAAELGPVAELGGRTLVHLPGWYRHGHRVLDVVTEEGGALAHTVRAT